MEHSSNSLIVVGQEIAKMKRDCVEAEPRNVHCLPTTGTIKDLKERLARAREKRWLPPRQTLDAQDVASVNEGLTEDFLLLCSVINTVTDSC